MPSLVCVGVVGGVEKEAVEAAEVGVGGDAGCGGVSTGFKIDQKNKQRQVFSEKGRKVPTQDQRPSHLITPVCFHSLYKSRNQANAQPQGLSPAQFESWAGLSHGSSLCPALNLGFLV